MPSHSNLYVLLRAHTATRVPALRSAIASLLCHTLSNGILFQHDPDEVSLWLDSLPSFRRSPDAEAPDGAPLTDESQAVGLFLDDSAQRCIKTPYRYIEDLQKLSSSLSNDAADSSMSSDDFVEHTSAYPSALLMTVLEQLEAKLRAKLLSASDTLAIMSFVRRLVLKLMTKTSTLSLLHEFAKKIENILQPHALFEDYPVMTKAIRREASIMIILFEHPFYHEDINAEMASSDVQDFLNQLEEMALRKSHVI